MKNSILLLLFLIGHGGYSQTASSIQLTVVPDWGSATLLQGKVHQASLGDHGVAVYIFVEEAGGWWNKPSWANPVTPIQPDSGFHTNIVVGGLDQFATKIIAFLVPLPFSPPLLSGGELPGSLFSFPYTVTCRPHGDRIISWSGFDWTVKKSVGSSLIPIGPGPNIFNDNDSMVWVDPQQRLHLRIAKNGDDWHCTELICNASRGYNRYIFDVGSRVDLLDPKIIAGIFTWDDCAQYAIPPDNYFREIDFEFSRWGNPTNDNSQFVVQPYDLPGQIYRFNMDLSGVGHSVHSFTWTPGSIMFNSTWGDSSHSWSYSNPSGIPIPGNENVRVNFHLFYGAPPSDHNNAELILNSFVTTSGEKGHLREQVKIFPNPVVQDCMIDIQSDSFRDAEIGIINLQGRFLRIVFTGTLIKGSNRIEWDGKSGFGNSLQPGLYLLYIKAKAETGYFKIVKL